jgi:uncharacterized membrane protein YsdA (DUF1294 family)
MTKMFLLYIVMVNVIGFFLMYWDKEKAKKGKYRIPESTLWNITIAGGAIGTSLGMKRFRHKTNHKSFRYGFPVIALLDTGIILYILLT